MKYLFALLFLIHASHAYILLTANLEDVQALAKELSTSPITDQLKKIWRRASKHFNQDVAIRKEDHQESDFMNQRAESETSSELSVTTKANPRRSGDQDNQAVDDIISLGKNASYYLNSMKQIILDHKGGETTLPVEEKPPHPEEIV